MGVVRETLSESEPYWDCSSKNENWHTHTHRQVTVASESFSSSWYVYRCRVTFVLSLSWLLSSTTGWQVPHQAPRCRATRRRYADDVDWTPDLFSCCCLLFCSLATLVNLLCVSKRLCFGHAAFHREIIQKQTNEDFSSFVNWSWERSNKN